MYDKNKSGVENLVNILSILRGENGCPWDAKQTHETLLEHLYEEVAEFADAVSANDKYNMCEELGDILLHIVFHSQIAKDENEFNFEKVSQLISEKMIRRHPHVFGDNDVENADEVVTLWNEIKKKEKGESRKSVMDGVPKSLSALLQARKIQKKGATYGFDWDNQNAIIAKIEEELAEVKDAIKNSDENHVDEEIGDLLFAVTNLSRWRKRETAEILLKKTNQKFITRFKYIEEQLEKQGKSLEEANIDEMEKLWNEAKINLCK